MKKIASSLLGAALTTLALSGCAASAADVEPTAEPTPSASGEDFLCNHLRVSREAVEKRVPTSGRAGGCGRSLGQSANTDLDRMTTTTLHFATSNGSLSEAKVAMGREKRNVDGFRVMCRNARWIRISFWHLREARIEGDDPAKSIRPVPGGRKGRVAAGIAELTQATPGGVKPATICS